MVAIIFSLTVDPKVAFIKVDAEGKDCMVRSSRKAWFFITNFDDPERHDLKSRFLLIILLFFFPLFLGSKRGKKE